MPPALEALSLFQVGIQGAFGTPVAATAKLAVPSIIFRPVDTRHAPRLAKGLAVRNRGNEFAVNRGVDWEIPDAPWYYEQGQTYLLTTVAGGVVAVGAGPYTWTFTRSMTTDPALNALTLERRARDWSTNEDMEVPDCYGRSITWKYAENQPLMFAMTGFGRMNDDASTLTAAQTLPTPEFVPSALLQLWINDTYAAIGTTQITAQVIGMDWTFNSGYMPQMTADGRVNLDYTIPILNPDEVSLALSLTLLMDPTRFALEKAAARAQTVRAIQAKCIGSGSRALTLKGLFKYATPDILELGVQNGQHIVALTLEETTDDTNFFEAIVGNATNAPDGVT